MDFSTSNISTGSTASSKRQRKKFHQISIKFPPDLRTRIAAYAESVCQPGTKWSFSSVVFSAIDEFLTKRGF